MFTSMITLEAVREGVASVRQKIGDNERAHLAEDQLLREVLQAIADGVPNARLLASEALKVTEIEYDRWYA